MGILLKIAIKTHLPQFIGYGATYFAVLAGAVLLGCVAYLIIEKPLLKLCRRARDINSRKRNDKIKLNGIEST
jgi:peptidoglycan/LPS O-acetylase OafA/YrhL